MSTRLRSSWLLLPLAVLTGPGLAWGLERRTPGRFDAVLAPLPGGGSGVRATPVEELAPADPLRSGWEAFRAEHGPAVRVYLDPGSFAPLLVEGPGIPLASGRVVGTGELAGALRDFVGRFAGQFRTEAGELVLDDAASAPLTPDLRQVVFSRAVSGVPVTGSRLIFYVHGNRIAAFGATLWPPVAVDPAPVWTRDEALAALRAHMGLGDQEPVEVVEPGSLSFVILRAAVSGEGAPGGYRPALAWRIVLRVPGEPGTWAAQVDAHTGAVVAFADEDRYSRVRGGVLPESGDGNCPSGCEQPATPMPYVDVATDSGTQPASSMGLVSCEAPSVMTTYLTGPYAAIADECGAIAESAPCAGGIDLRTSELADCSVPAGASPGNTRASRTAFYHVNRAAERARTYLPTNAWLSEPLPTNVNAPFTCNAFYSANSVNFYRSGGGCGNTGEIAGVVVHEWAHGLDDHDGGGWDNPYESTADTAEFLADRTSCVGRGFRADQTCSGYGDTCLDCTGVREQDWDKRAAHSPATANGFVSQHCPAGDGPCGTESHCESHLGAEPVWDLATRDLPAMGVDLDTAWQIVERLWYLARTGSGGDLYNCSIPHSDGCGAGTLFTRLRQVDDDDGNPANGTPHAAAIHAAFARHKIACGTAGDTSNQNHSACPALTAPVLSATAGSSSVSLSWGASAGAASYRVLRSDLRCNHAPVQVATVPSPSTSFTDTGLPDGFTLYYRVQPVGQNPACLGAVSSCLAVAPQPTAGAIALDRTAYGLTIPIEITVRDSNAGAGAVTASIWSDSELAPQEVTLIESPPGSALFAGTIGTTPAAPAADGLLSLADGDVITARYVDADDGLGGHGLVREVTAVADGRGPAIHSVGVSDVGTSAATVTWVTDEIADSRVRWGTAAPPDQETTSGAQSTAHAVRLLGLAPCTLYYYGVGSTDPSGNAATDDHSGRWFYFETLAEAGSGAQACHSGSVALDQTVYGCAHEIRVAIEDADLAGQSTALATVTSSTETMPETVLLAVSTADDQRFEGTITTTTGPAQADGLLSVRNGDLVTAVYRDADDAAGGSRIATANAVIDCDGPAIEGLQVVDEPPFLLTLSWNTSEPSTSRIDFGDTPELGRTTTDPVLATKHWLSFWAPDLCSAQYFRLTSTDSRGYSTVVDRGGTPHVAHSGMVPGTIFVENFETPSGWSLEGEWQIAAPRGLGGVPNYSSDPPYARSGLKALGTDLTGLNAHPGDYEPNVDIEAVSPPIDATSLANATVIYQSWLNCEKRGSDYVDLDAWDGAEWHGVWWNWAAPTRNINWQRMARSVAEWADGNPAFQLRFRLRSNATNQYSGWNIDGVVLKDGSLPDKAPCGGCGTPPSFAGVERAVDQDPCSDTGVHLAWTPAPAWGTGANGTYAVYRGTAPDFEPGPATLVQAGIAARDTVDATAPNDVELFFVVRAENDETCAGGPANGGLLDANEVRLSARDETSQPPAPGLGATLRLAVVDGAHVRLTWDGVPGAVLYAVYRAENPRMEGATRRASVVAPPYDDLGETAFDDARFYLVRAANACGDESP
ncbi:MAG: fibronectin type III domain-containing protein [Acidobacteria bacterium]|nr:fibronectin type III domain-containing protein [Acidobacteriota bacterium]